MVLLRKPQRFVRSSFGTCEPHASSYLIFHSGREALPSFQYRIKVLVSVSCLHVAEHIGLGRYGDPIDPLGTNKALLELQRVLAPGGVLLFSMPVGRERVEFNAQRIWDPRR